MARGTALPLEMDGLPEMLTIGEVATFARISARQAWELVYRGDLPVVRISPRIARVPRAALKAWLEQRVEVHG